MQFGGVQFKGGVTFQSARIEKDASLGGMRVDGDINLVRLTAAAVLNLMQSQIYGNVDLREACSNGVALGHAAIRGNVDATGASFFYDRDVPSSATFHRTSFGGGATFDRVTFPTTIVFGERAEVAEFDRTLSLRKATFGSADASSMVRLEGLRLSELLLDGCTVYGALSLSRTRIDQPLELTDIRVISALPHESARRDSRDAGKEGFPKQLDLTGVTLERGGELRAIRVEGEIVLSLGEVEGQISIVDVEATDALRIRDTSLPRISAVLSCGRLIEFYRCQFSQGGVLRCDSPELQVTLCDAPKALTISSGGEDRRTSLTSLDGTNVENFVLSRLDLSRTVFAGCMNLDKVRIEGASEFGRQPFRIGSRREVIREELLTRASNSKRWQKKVGARSTEGVEASWRSVAATYRALRKSREDGKDEPGGADFYYGEMEMRRKAARFPSIEKTLLTAYWLVAGYALRAWRSFLFLVTLLTGLAFVLSRFGFNGTQHPNWFDAARQLSLVSVGIQRPPDALNAIGDTVLLAGRLAVPALIALTIFALRGRVKR